MAYTAEGGLSFSLQDSATVRGSLHVPVLLDPTKTVTQLAAAWNTQAALLDAVTGAKILYGQVTIVLRGAGMTFTPKSPTPTVGVQIESSGLVGYPNAVSGALYGSLIPGISVPPAFPSMKAIDESQAVFTAYIAPFETPPAEWAATNNVYQRLNAHTQSEIVFRKHRRAMTRASRENP